MARVSLSTFPLSSAKFTSGSLPRRAQMRRVRSKTFSSEANSSAGTCSGSGSPPVPPPGRSFARSLSAGWDGSPVFAARLSDAVPPRSSPGTSPAGAALRGAPIAEGRVHRAGFSPYGPPVQFAEEAWTAPKSPASLARCHRTREPSGAQRDSIPRNRYRSPLIHVKPSLEHPEVASAPVTMIATTVVFIQVTANCPMIVAPLMCRS